MPNDLSQDGIGNIGILGLSGPTVNITQILGKSVQYQDLCEQLETHEKLFALIPEDDLDERLKVSKKVNQFKDLIRQFKEDVLRLAEQFEKIEINSERIKQAKEFFDKGEIGEARAILEADIEQMQDEHLYLIRQREKFENEILPQLKNNSDEFYILALSKQTDYADADWFVNTCTYFEKSIAAFPAKKNVFQYALFLQNHNQFSKAESFYQKFLTDFSAFIDLPESAMTLNNLAVFHSNKNEYEDALKEFAEALEIYRKLAAENPSAYLPNVAMTLNNLGNLHKNKNEYEDALKEYEEALEIRRKLAAENPSAYLPDMAMTLNNLAVLHKNKNEYEDALKEFAEALEIRRKLANENPQVYIIDVAQTCYNLASFHKEYRNDKESSIKMMIETVSILLPLAENVPYTQRYLQTAVGFLQKWELSEEDIVKLIAQRLADEEDSSGDS